MMKSQIIDYYISEKQWSGYGLWIAITVVAFSAILWSVSSANNLQRGLSYALATGGLLFIMATGLAIRHNNQRIDHAKQVAEQNDQVLQRQEIARMEDVMKNAYKAGLVSFTVSLVTGIILLLVFKTSFNKGIALGVLLFGTYGLVMEMLSMRLNRAYLQQVKAYQVPASRNAASVIIDDSWYK